MSNKVLEIPLSEARDKNYPMDDSKFNINIFGLYVSKKLWCDCESMEECNHKKAILENAGYKNVTIKKVTLKCYHNRHSIYSMLTDKHHNKPYNTYGYVVEKREVQ